ncbi:tetraspanin-2A [Diachasmimorpha longicaudata]|uniref:tetraspanin-2A n=1 Tax=Diachasmimorpha longicaudata TaxID=58733 RepID=UPI0030B8F500
MAIKGSEAARLERAIGCVKYTVFSFNAILWIFGAGMFGVSVWMRADPGFQEWVEFLEMQEFYIGLYILIIASILVMVVAFFGCAVVLMEHILGLYIHIGLQMLGFCLGLAGTGVLLDYSTYDSNIQPIIRKSMTSLIVNSQYEKPAMVLRMIQEGIGCCGSDGPMDYLSLYKPLPTECRDTVTGNAFFHGCVEELTWFLETRSGWLAGLALSLCLLHVIQAVLSLILIQARQKEDEATIYKR